jgi:integrase
MATKRADGRWAASWTNPATKKREWFYGRTEREAEDQLRDRRAGRSKNGPTPSADLDFHTLAGLLWYPRFEQSRPNTIRRYRDAYTNHVRPTFGQKRPGDIRPADVQKWVNRLAQDGVATNSIILYKSILSSILKLCVAEGLIPSNPAATAKLPPKPKRIRTMTLQMTQMLLGKAEGTELAAPVFLAAVMGLSRGELCGLKWSNVDPAKRKVSVTEQRLIRQGIKGKKVGEGPPKRESRIRSFVLPPSLFEILERVGNLDSDYVCTRANGRPWNPEHLTGEWAARRERWGFGGWHFHDLRHGAAGNLAALGVDLLTIGAILGHSSISTTQIYAAAQEDTASRGLERVAEALFGRQP